MLTAVFISVVLISESGFSINKWSVQLAHLCKWSRGPVWKECPRHIQVYPTQVHSTQEMSNWYFKMYYRERNLTVTDITTEECGMMGGFSIRGEMLQQSYSLEITPQRLKVWEWREGRSMLGGRGSSDGAACVLQIPRPSGSEGWPILDFL